ncbi:MAG TPA: flagellar filament capping protein FliD [Polyangiaceae bacterium]
MAGTISFGGVGSGMDTESIVTGLVNASRGAQDAMKARQGFLTSATSALSTVSSLLGKLKTALEGVDEAREVGSYTATSSNAAIVASANGTASPGSFAVSVQALASEQRSYSNGYASSTTALGLTGSLGLSVAGGTVTSIELSATDTLENIASKINSSGLRVSASVFNDGTENRLQVRGLDSGAANTIAFSGTTLGLELAANKKQAATDARMTIDGFTVTRPTNQISGAIQGVTLALTQVTTAPVTVEVKSDPEGLKKKLTSVVDAYNAVIDNIHTVAGFGSTKGSQKELVGDPVVRSITNRMSNSVTQVIGSGTYSTLGSLGVSLGRDGKLTLDGAKLDKALAADPSAVAKVIGGTDTTSGAADVLRDVVTAFTQSGTGLIASRQETLNSRSKALKQRIDNEEERLQRYAAALRKQFTVMDGIVAENNSKAGYF